MDFIIFDLPYNARYRKKRWNCFATIAALCMISLQVHSIDKCGNSCSKCDSNGKCVLCIDGMYLSSGACYFCADGQYFDKTSYSCQNCANYCNGLCSYRLDCFKCNNTQIFSLFQMKCVDSCSTGEVMIQSDYIHGLKVCRSLDYYIYPSSESILELGTRQNPYKNINLVFIELFNFVDASKLNVTIRLSLGDKHVLEFGVLGLINNYNVTIQPFNEISSIFSDTSYDSTSRSTIIFQDYNITKTSVTSMFNLMSYFSLNSSVTSSFPSDVQKLIKLYHIGFFVVNSTVTFKNIRFENSYMHISSIKAIWFAPTKLETKAFTLTNVDIRCTATILRCSDSINFVAKNIKVIDYLNLKTGFSFPTDCNYQGASTVGEIVIDGMHFSNELTDDVFYRIGSLIDIRSPFNITISNSNFKVTNKVEENFDIIIIQDSGVCSPDDNIVQNILFVNNTLTLDTLSQNAFINVVFTFSDANKRYKNIILSNNVFVNINGPENSLVEIDYYSQGSVVITNNSFQNCSTTSYLMTVNANDFIDINNLSFDTCDVSQNGLLYLGSAANITIDNLVVTKTTNSGFYKSASFIYLATVLNGNVYCNHFYFSNNNAGVAVIQVDKSIGLIAISNSTFTNEIVTSSTPYIYVQDIFHVKFTNLTFTNIQSNTVYIYETPLLIFFKNIQIDMEGDILVDTVSLLNSSISFLSISTISRSTVTPKDVILQNIMVKDCTFKSRSDLISLGPIFTTSPLNFAVKNIEFNNLTFTNNAIVLMISIQTPNPVTIANLKFKNIYGGSILLQPASTSTGTNKVVLNMQNVTVSDNDFATSTLFVLNDYCTLNVSNCNMLRNSAYFYGSISSILGDNSAAYFNSCNFANNNGVNGGLFYVAANSFVSLTNCLLFSNLAINAAIAYIENLGNMVIDGCDISYNLAMHAGLIQIVGTINPTIIANSKIYSNMVVLYDTTIADIDNSNVCINLCFASNGYVNFLLTHRNIMSQSAFNNLFDVTQGLLSISNSSFTDMDSLSIVSCYNGQIVISDAEINNLKLKSKMMLLVSSSVNIANFKVSNITQYSNFIVNLINIQFNTNLIIKNSTFTNIQVRVLYSDISSFRMDVANLFNISCDQSLIQAGSSTSIVMSNLNITKSISASSVAIISFINSNVTEISNSSLSEIQYRMFEFNECNVDSFKNNVLNGINKGIQFASHSNATLYNCTFANFVQNIESGGIYKSAIQDNGSGIKIIDSNISVDKCTFINNTAVYGAGIYLDCNYKYNCVNDVRNSYFKNGIGLVKGGAMVYNSYVPTLTNNTFINNTAPFWPDVGNYVVKLMMVADNGTTINIKSLDSISSGSVIETPIKLAVINNEGNIDYSDNKNIIKIMPLDSETDVKGQTTVLIQSGEAAFSSTIFVGIPGKQNVRYAIKSSAIDYTAMELVDPQYSEVQILTVSFRLCKPGEYQFQNECLTCAVGSYSLLWNETKCYSCPDHASCEGASISLSSGYWRMDGNSTDIIECPNSDACLGGYNPNSTHPVYCADGYEGLLCNECVVIGDQKYERISDNQCSKCPDPTLNFIRIIGFGVLILIFLIIMILVNLQKKEDSNVSVLMRIMTNYLQMIAAALAFNLQFPNYFNSILSSVRQAGNSSGIFLSFDCFLMSTRATEIFNNVSYFKVMCIALIPVAFIGVCVSLYRVVFLKDNEKFKRWTCVTIITVLFVLQPTLVQYCLKVFKCINVGNGMSKVEMDIQTECWSAVHLKWVLSIALPMLVVYVIGAPLLAFVILFKSRMKLDKPEVIRYILLLYQGLRHECYYWELVNTTRKVILLSLKVFVSEEYEIMKALIGVLVLFICALLQARLNPFKIKLISRLEHREMLASLLTLYGGLIFAQADSRLVSLSIAFYVVIILVNIRFIILWIFCMLTVFKSRKYPGLLALYMKRALCMSIDNEDEDLLCYKSKLTTDSIIKSNNHESVGDTKKTIMKNNTTTKGLKDKREELSDIRNVRQAFQDFQSENRSSSIRTPKRLLFKFKKRKDHDLNSNKIKTEGGKSTNKKKHKKKFKWIGSSKLPLEDELNSYDEHESPQFESLKKDLIKVKDEQADFKNLNMSKIKSIVKDHFPHPSITRIENEFVIAEENNINVIRENKGRNQSKEIWRIIKVKDS